MNKRQEEIEKRKVLDMVRHTSRSGNQMNCFKFYNSEKENHIRLKFETFLTLRRMGFDCWTEIIFLSGIRMDILGFREGRWINVEVLSTETEEKLLFKAKKYPSEIELIKISSEKDLKELEMI